MVQYHTRIKLHETDAAGVLFFASQLKIAHDAYEEFLTQIGFPIHSLLGEKEYFLPIVHTEADYFMPLRAGDRVSVEVYVEGIGNSSFTLVYLFRSAEGDKTGEVKTVHVAVQKKEQQKISVPGNLRQALRKHLLTVR